MNNFLHHYAFNWYTTAIGGQDPKTGFMRLSPLIELAIPNHFMSMRRL